MKKMLSAAAILAFCFTLLSSSLAALAQDRDRDRDGDRRDGDRDRDERRQFDPRDIIRQADDNGDGIIEPSEVGSRSGYYVRRAAERVGLDPSKPLPVVRILPALEAMRNESSSNRSSSGSSRGQTATPSASGFAATATPAPAVPGFDVPLTASSGVSLDKKFDARVIEYVDRMMRERDANKNGILERNEWTGRWRTPPEESDTNKDGVLDKEELCVRIAKSYGISGTNSSTPSSTSSSASSNSGPLTRGASGSSGSSTSETDAQRYKRYAEGFIRQYDRNRDGKLDRDEASRLRPEHQAADTNKDGVIVVDELAIKLQSYSAGTAGASGSSSGSSGRDGERRYGYGSRGSSSADNKTAAEPRKSYRFVPATERLPKGLPDWFLRGDGNGDGQVSMAEYTTTWTEQLAAEFMKYDANADGIITPEECQAQDKPRR